MLVRPVKVTVKCMERMYADEWAFLGTSRSVRTLISHGRIALDSKRFVLQHVQWRLVKCGPGKTKFELENILDSRVHFLSHITDGDLHCAIKKSKVWDREWSTRKSAEAEFFLFQINGCVEEGIGKWAELLNNTEDDNYLSVLRNEPFLPKSESTLIAMQDVKEMKWTFSSVHVSKSPFHSFLDSIYGYYIMM